MYLNVTVLKLNYVLQTFFEVTNSLFITFMTAFLDFYLKGPER